MLVHFNPVVTLVPRDKLGCFSLLVSVVIFACVLACQLGAWYCWAVPLWLILVLGASKVAKVVSIFKGYLILAVITFKRHGTVCDLSDFLSLGFRALSVSGLFFLIKHLLSKWKLLVHQTNLPDRCPPWFLLLRKFQKHIRFKDRFSDFFDEAALLSKLIWHAWMRILVHLCLLQRSVRCNSQLIVSWSMRLYVVDWHLMMLNWWWRTVLRLACLKRLHLRLCSLPHLDKLWYVYNGPISRTCSACCA